MCVETSLSGACVAIEDSHGALNSGICWSSGTRVGYLGAELYANVKKARF